MKTIINFIRLLFSKKESDTVRDQVDWSQYDIPTLIRKGIPYPWDVKVKGGAK